MLVTESFFGDRVVLDADGFVAPAFSRLMDPSGTDARWIVDFLRGCPDLHLAVPDPAQQLDAYLLWAEARGLAPSKIHRRPLDAIQDRVIWLNAVAEREFGSALVTANLMTAARSAGLWDHLAVYWINFRTGKLARLSLSEVKVLTPSAFKTNWNNSPL